MIKEFLFEDRNALFSTLATDCRKHLNNAISDYGSTSFLVSGGSTPAPLYEALSQSDLDWFKVHVALVDERWVDFNHEASNEALIYRTLLINKARHATFTSMKTGAVTSALGCPQVEGWYQQLPKPFAVSILGMGGDGHTASLFPHAEGLNEALNENNPLLTAAIMANQSEITGTNVERITLSLTGLLNSQRLIILLTGEEKLAVFRNALADLSDEAVKDMPVRAILRQDIVPVELYWAP